ncbi:MAG: molybdenum cofactor biosynthesis protein MoaE [Methanobacterium sp.]|jgi:molybdopterin synthase catalytic subunit|uniref:molybdenum cofactor biosynthesis protein MoaE n=1 Tax=Methanobacterium sp. TaxID=2164 RepID=UPI0025894AF0|nr:molybdenum cofactor biosynthesis protein MoaE [Methanobacterium sp.]MCC7560317.1 molybdenum cofactor biosynthesis protein MoaE [Methanobacterium sp.]
MIFARIIPDYEEIITLNDLTQKIKETPSIGECGAIFTFEGIVRGKDEVKTTDEMVLTSPDPEKTEKELEKILIQVQEKNGVKEIAVVHYLGHFKPGDPLFLVAVAGSHRHETREALEEIIERVKYELDFKKEEKGSAGSKIIMSGG